MGTVFILRFSLPEGRSLKGSTATPSTATLASGFQVQEAWRGHKAPPSCIRRRETYPVFGSLLQRAIYHIHCYSGLMLRNWSRKVSFLPCSSSSNPLRHSAWSVVLALFMWTAIGQLQFCFKASTSKWPWFYISCLVFMFPFHFDKDNSNFSCIINFSQEKPTMLDMIWIRYGPA